MTKALGFMSDEAEDDYAVITDSYKPPEGSLEERTTMMAAVREAAGHSSPGSAALSLRYPGRKGQDVYLQLVDLEEGVYGEPFTIALYLHASCQCQVTGIGRILGLMNGHFLSRINPHRSATSAW